MLVSASTAPLVDAELATSASTGSRTSPRPSASTSSATASSRRSSRSTARTCPCPRRRSSGASSELAEVVALLSDEATRLLTLTGPGGTGRLASRCRPRPRSSEPFPDGVWWVPLAPLRDPALVLETAAQVARLRRTASPSTSPTSDALPLRQLRAGGGGGAELAALLAACPNLEVLVTSRERLRVRGEQTYPVPPLAESTARRSSSRAPGRSIPPSTPTRLCAELCVRLDELPLALELAAARTRALQPRAAPRAALAASRPAQGRPRRRSAPADPASDDRVVVRPADARRSSALFARLSVFAGGCTLRGRGAGRRRRPGHAPVAPRQEPRPQARSSGEPRYWMLETIREYAAERLDSGHDGDAPSSAPRRLLLASGGGSRAPSDGGRASTLDGTARDRARKPAPFLDSLRRAGLEPRSSGGRCADALLVSARSSARRKQAVRGRTRRARRPVAGSCEGPFRGLPARAPAWRLRAGKRART